MGTRLPALIASGLGFGQVQRVLRDRVAIVLLMRVQFVLATACSGAALRRHR